MKFSKMLKRTGAAALAFVIASSSVMLTVSAAGRTPDGMISGMFDSSYYNNHGMSESLISTTKDTKLVKYLRNALMNLEENIDLSEFKINWDEWVNVSNIILDVYPELFFISGTWTSWRDNSGLVTYVSPEYLYVDANGKPDKQKINSMLKEFYAEADYYLEMVNDKSVYKDDLSKAMLLHDEIVLDMRYDLSNRSNYTFAIDKYGVCENYAELYAYLLGQLGIKTEIVDSVLIGDAGHEWMKICLDGKWYNIDPTWDDPTWNSLDEPGKVPHKYFLLSDSQISQIDDSGVHSGYLKLHASNDKKYDNYKIHNYNSKLCKVSANDKIVYAVDNDNKKIVKYNYETDKETTIINLSGYKWSAGSNQTFVQSMTSLEAYGGCLFYNTPKGIYRYNLTTGKSDLLYVPRDSSNQFFGLRIKDDNLYTITGKYSRYDVNMGYCCKVSELVNEAKSVKLDKTSVTMNVGDSIVLTATVEPEGAYGFRNWTTSSESIADIDIVDGVVYIRAKKAGTATITVEIPNGNKATCKITVQQPATGITLNKTSASLYKGETVTLNATVNPSDTTDKKITWKSSNTNVAAVSSSGVVTAKGAGTAVITAQTSNGKKATCTVTVKNSVEVTGVTLSKTSVSLYKGDTATLSATVNPSNATNKKVTWTTSNSNVATVSNGKITAKGIGTATITAQTANGKKATCIVTVKNKTVDPTSVGLSKTSISLYKGETATLSATVNPSNATNKKVTWTTSNSNVATVSNGKITAKGAGTATITAQTSNGKKATCIVTVKNKTVDPTSVKLSKTSVSLEKGKTTTLSATVNPSNATNKKVTWTTSNSKVATVSGGKITAKGVGTATITAKTVNGKKATCKVTVKNSKTVNPTSIKLSKTSVSLTKGKTTTLKATVNPSNATNKKVTWTTSNSKVATVSGGKITAKGVGTATITAKTANGKKATCKVMVKNNTVKGNTVNPTSIWLSDTFLTLTEGQSATVTTTIFPSNATNKKVTWTTSNSKVATVSNGRITAKGVGTATITAKTSNGKTDDCLVIVNSRYGIRVGSVTISVSGNATSNISLTLSEGEYMDIVVKGNNNLKWTTTNSKVAVVTDGKVVAKGSGKATLKAKTSSGSVIVCNVTVR